jgi:hypothetical protein
LSSNALTGTLSPTFGSQWNNLLQINLSDNQFVGAVPTTFGVGWQYLQSLNLGGSNSFSNATFSFGPSQWLNTLTTCVIDTVVFTCPLPEWTSNQACANSVSNMQCMVTPAPTAPTLNSVGQLLTFKLLVCYSLPLAYF